MNKRHLISYAFRQSIPVLLGYVFLGIAFGILLQQAGFSWLWALVISVLVYAGSMQFALVSLLTAGTPLSMVALMTLMVNSRHLFYGLSFVEMFREMKKKQPYMIFSLTDETYSVLCATKDAPEMAESNHFAAFCLSILNHFYWVFGSVVGAVAGELIPFDATGIDFSMTALFIVILIDQLRGAGKDARQSALLGLVFALVFLLILGADSFLLPTLICTVLALAVTDRVHAAKEGTKHE